MRFDHRFISAIVIASHHVYTSTDICMKAYKNNACNNCRKLSRILRYCNCCPHVRSTSYETKVIDIDL